MPRPTPFHPRTRELCTSLSYKEWAGYHAVCRFDVYHDREYYALRNQATVMDATPLYKLDVRGPNALDLVNRVAVRGFDRHAVGRVSYVVWCDDAGKVLDDGTITRLAEDHFRVTSAEPALGWFQRNARGLDVTLRDCTDRIGALALQGPLARDVLHALAGSAFDDLRFFRARTEAIRLGTSSVPLLVTRTGYTGDLGFELWIENEHALALYDALLEAGKPYGLLPMGLDALDVSRVEAGFLLAGVDYTSARHALIERQTSSPFELSFDWMVQLDREPFVGQAALRRELERGVSKRFVGLEVDWNDFEAIYESFRLVPHLETATCRLGVPLYRGGRQIGYATSRTWSPLLKRYLALATVDASCAGLGTELEIEVTCEYERHRARARVTETPFFDPERKKA
ncbi:MAG TPA: aminomethyl transferase family protein [Planctomycetes bacterium]|nr:aminomethyl transferase family protein [Planctomycetota bacterium]